MLAKLTPAGYAVASAAYVAHDISAMLASTAGLGLFTVPTALVVAGAGVVGAHVLGV
jgi:hypothetical protein